MKYEKRKDKSVKCFVCEKKPATWNKIEAEGMFAFCWPRCESCKEKETADYNRQQLGKLFN